MAGRRAKPSAAKAFALCGGSRAFVRRNSERTFDAFPSPTVAALLIGASAPIGLVAPAFAQTCLCPPVGEAIRGRSSRPAKRAAAARIRAAADAGARLSLDPRLLGLEQHRLLLGTRRLVCRRASVCCGLRPIGASRRRLPVPRRLLGAHIGFYGGINYGFGYAGALAGGRWENGQFFYNRAVNNLGAAPVTRVYNQRIAINNTTIDRVSYNSGQGELQVKPTPEQEQVAAERRIAATPAQVTQVRTASINPEQFHSTNRGDRRWPRRRDPAS